MYKFAVPTKPGSSRSPESNAGKLEGEVVEWSITAVLKTVELRGSGGSNPSLSAPKAMLRHRLFRVL